MDMITLPRDLLAMAPSYLASTSSTAFQCGPGWPIQRHRPGGRSKGRISADLPGRGEVNGWHLYSLLLCVGFSGGDVVGAIGGIDFDMG